MRYNRAMARKNGSSVVVAKKSIKKSIGASIAVHGPVGLIADSAFTYPKDWYQPSSSDVYRTNAWVYGAIRSIAQNLSCVSLRWQHGPKDQPQDIDEFSTGAQLQLYELFQRPNDLVTSYQLIEYTTAYLNLDGVAHWVLDRESINEIPRSMTPVGASFMEPIIDYGAGKFLGWVYRADFTGEAIPLRFDQVLTFRFFNPYDPIRGLSPIQAAMRGISVDYAIGNYTYSFFQNGGIPSGILTTDKRMTTMQARQQIDLWEERHRGSGNAHRVAMLHSGTKYQPTGQSQKEMEFIQQKKWTRDEILAVLKVPKSELSLYEEIAHATAVSQDRSYWQKTLIPIGKNIIAVLMGMFVRGIAPNIAKGLRVFFDFDTVPALQDSLSEKIKNAELMYRMGYPINHINTRLQLGMPTEEWGDIWWPNASVASILDIMSGKVSPSVKPSGPAETPTGNDTITPGDEEQPDGETPNEPTNPSDDENRRAFLRLAKLNPFKQVDLAIRKELKNYLWRLRSYQLARLVKDGTLFSIPEWETKLVRRLEKYYNGIFRSLKAVLPISLPDKFEKVNFELNKSINDTLSERFSTCTTTEEKMKNVKIFFNELTSEEKLAKIARMEILMTIQNGLKRRSA